MRQILQTITVIVLVVIIQAEAFGQFGQDAFNFQQQQQTQGQTSSLGNVVLDTSDIFYFYSANPKLILPFKDSLLDEFQQYDPIRQRKLNYAHLGNLGSAFRQLIYQAPFRRGFDVGLHQFDIYKLDASQLRYYKITQAYTHAFFSQGPSQNHSYFKIRFSRNFANGINLSLDHKKINNAGSYDFQKTRNTAFAIGLWYHAPDGRYDGFFSFASTTIQQQDNGGIVEEPKDTLLPPFQIAVNLQNARTQQAQREWTYIHYFQLNKPPARPPRPPQTMPGQHSAIISIRDSVANAAPDSLEQPAALSPAFPNQTEEPLPPKRAFTLYHRLRYQFNSYKFSDSSLAEDASFYQNLQVDERGLRHYLKVRKLENTFKIQTFKLHKSTTEGPQQQSDLLEVGLIHTLYFLDQEPVDTSNFNDLFLMGRINFTPNERLKIFTYAQFGLLGNAGDYRISGSLFLHFKTVGNLRLEFINQLYEPSLLQQRIFISQRQFWKNNFDKTLETSVSGTYSLPSFRFSLTASYHLLTNYIYFDSQALPRQTSSAINIFQLMVEKNFQLGTLHLNNLIAFQQVTKEDVLRLPQIYSTHSLFLEGKIFKKVMLARLGFDARLASSYTPDTYQPLTGQFHIQNKQTLPFTPLLDFFLSFKVNRFRFFFKVENILTGITNRYYYQTANSPLAFGLSNGGIRFGISWRFVD